MQVFGVQASCMCRCVVGGDTRVQVCGGWGHVCAGTHVCRCVVCGGTRVCRYMVGGDTRVRGHSGLLLSAGRAFLKKVKQFFLS